MGWLRTFIAADIPPAVQKSIQQQVDRLRNKLGDSSIRWTPVHNIHLTLKFLGDISTNDVDILTQALRAESNAHPAFDVPIQRLGSFPNSKRARVLFIGIQPPAELEALQQGVEAACEGVGYEADMRPFSPHLTIGRVRRGISPSEQGKIYEILRDATIDSLGIARVDSLHLYKSERKPNGAVYTKLFSAPLQTRGEI